MEFSKKSKIILLSSILVILFSLVRIKIDNKSKYSLNDNYIYGQVIEKKVHDNRISIVVQAKEKVLLNYYDHDLDVELGNYIKAHGEFVQPKKNSVFNLFNYRNYLKSKRINWIFKISSYEINNRQDTLYKIKNSIQKRIEKYNNNYLNIFILGDNQLDSQVYKSYQVNGISHLFAISGMHISLLTFILSLILKKVLKKEFLCYILIFIFLLFYMFLTNFSPSVIRSSLLFVGISLNKIFKWNFATIDILLIILITLLVYNPYYFYSISFLFSFVISFYLILFSHLINKFNNYFIKIFIISLMSFLVSLPITVNNFFEINILSPLINIIAVPLISLIIFPLALITFIIPIFNPVLTFLLDKLEIVSLFLANFSLNISLGHMNFLMIIVYYLIVTSILIKIKKYKMIFLLSFLFIHYNLNYFSIYPEIVFIDVGQGDATLLKLPFNKGNILIDTGGNETYDISKNVLVPFLKASHIKRIDLLILSHGDYDHMGSSYELIEDFEVKKVIFNSYENNELETNLIKKLKTKKINYDNYNKRVLNISDYKFYFLNNKHYEENEDSLIIYTKINNKNILLTGDASKKNEKDLINEYNLPKMDILKVGHHGSKTSSDIEFLKKTRPNYSIISVASKNLYHHPHSDVLNNLEEVNSNIFLTSINGSIKFVLKKNMEIYTCY